MLKTKLSLSQADLNIECTMRMKVEYDLISKKMEFKDEMVVAFRGSRKYVKE